MTSSLQAVDGSFVGYKGIEGGFEQLWRSGAGSAEEAGIVQWHAQGCVEPSRGLEGLDLPLDPDCLCYSPLHLRRAWKVNSPRVGFRFTEFSEVHLWVADRWSVIRVMSSSCSQLCPVKEDSSSIRKSTSDLSSPWSARSARRRGKPNIS
jgi:hypothetical protein